MSSNMTLTLVSILLLSSLCLVDALFQTSVPKPRVFTARAAALKDGGGDSKTFLDEFKVNGDIVNPYSILKVSRSATKEEIKAAYRALSRKYHPDAARFRKILPGNCNNMEEVRNHWEKINFSYEILSDKRIRARFDRSSALEDPGAALGRMALSTVGWGIKSVGSTLLTLAKNAYELQEKQKNDDDASRKIASD